MTAKRFAEIEDLFKDWFWQLEHAGQFYVGPVETVEMVKELMTVVRKTIAELEEVGDE